MKKIVLIPKGFLGDILLTTPVIAALSRCRPDLSISVVCTPTTAEFVRRDPLVHEVIVYDRRRAHRGWRGLRTFANELKGHNFDVAYSFHKSPRTSLLLWLARIPERVSYSDAFLSFLSTRVVKKESARHEVIRNLSLVASELDQVSSRLLERLGDSPHESAPWADLRVPDVSRESLSERVTSILEQDPYIVLAPGSAWATKQWDVQGFRTVASHYLSKGVRVVLVGAPNDEHRCQVVARDLAVENMCGQTSVEELVALIAGARCVVCNDSLALHISSATKTPVVVIFCATSPRFGFGPWRARSVVLEKTDLFCKPCHRHGSKRCPTGTRLCMTGVSSTDVVCAVDSFLGEHGGIKTADTPLSSRF